MDSTTQRSEDELIGALQAVLFAAGETVSFEKLGEVLSIAPREAKLLSQKLETELNGADRAFEVYLTAEGAGLCTRTEFAPYVQSYLEIRRSVPLSKAALEALSVIAYQQPTTKSYVEKVRGVDCSGIFNGLLQRGLIEECGRMDAPGRPILYRTTDAFLRSFGLNSVEDLPNLEEHLQTVLEGAEDA